MTLVRKLAACALVVSLGVLAGRLQAHDFADRLVSQCQEEGGCVYVTRKQLQALQDRAFERGKQWQKVECGRFL